MYTTSYNPCLALVGCEEGPLEPNRFKHAMLRAAPSRFSFEFLPPTKQDGNYCHGMRICPSLRGDRSSISSTESTSEYEIWRKWEDCLFFQDTLEVEYKRAARSKRQRLLQGKGVKKGGFYKQDMASSWESLPPGPDPNSVARDIHSLIPRLNKKGTLFKASEATINQRQTEFQALVEAFFRDDMPSLIQELRSVGSISAFFAYWRQDYELDQTIRKQKSRRTSITSSVLSSYFSSSNVSLHQADSSSSKPSSPTKSMAKDSARNAFSRLRIPNSPERPRSMATDASTNISSTFKSSDITDRDTEIRTTRRRALSNSSDSSSTHSSGSSDSFTPLCAPSIASDGPILFGHNPQQSTIADRASSSPQLEVLPEEQDSFVKSNNILPIASSLPRDRRSNRTCQIIVAPGEAPDIQTPRPSEGYAAYSQYRESWQSTASNATILQGLTIAFPDNENTSSHRASMASIATFMTTNSANAVLPRTPSPQPFSHGDGPHSGGRPRQSIPVSLSDYEMWSEVDETDPYILDAFPTPASFIPDNFPIVLSNPQSPVSRPETPVNHKEPKMSRSIEYTSANPSPPSPAATMSTTFTMPDSISAASDITSIGGSLSIKAAYENTMIVLRIRRDITFFEVRERLYNKFVGQEGIPLPQNFEVAYVLPGRRSARTRNDVSKSPSDPSEIKTISSEDDWDDVVILNAGTGKLTLRLL